MGLSVLDFRLTFKRSGADEYRVAQMGWEQRGNNHYYYRKERSGSRVRSIYVGAGSLAQVTATMLAMEKEDRAIKKPKKAIGEFEYLDSDLDAFSGLLRTITEAAMIAAGFHQYKRQWRKLRA